LVARTPSPWEFAFAICPRKCFASITSVTLDSHVPFSLVCGYTLSPWSPRWPHEVANNCFFLLTRWHESGDAACITTQANWPKQRANNQVGLSEIGGHDVYSEATRVGGPLCGSSRSKVATGWVCVRYCLISVVIAEPGAVGSRHSVQFWFHRWECDAFMGDEKCCWTELKTANEAAGTSGTCVAV
jgi:hypothetical protein